jgi:hypothetical protein
MIQNELSTTTLVKKVPIPDENEFKILILVTGSVAGIKVEEIVCKLLEQNGMNDNLNKTISVIVALTTPSLTFVNISALEQRGILCFTDSDEWSVWKTKGDPVTHIEVS